MNPQENSELFDHAVEYQLLGWVLCDKNLIGNISYLNASVFSDPLHAMVWDAMKGLHRAGKDINPFTLKAVLPPDPQDEIPIITYLAKSISASLLMLRPLDGVKYLTDLANKRILSSACNSIDHSESVLENAAKINRAIQAISETSSDNEFDDNLMVSDAIIKDMRNTKLPYQTGIPKLDTAMDGGLYDGKSYGFAARKKVGKTCLAATISANLNQAGVKHLFICGEMSPKEIHQRVLARYAGIFPSAYRGDYGKTLDCERKVMEAIKQMPRNTLYKNAPGITFDSLRSICTLAVERHAVKGIILDYWQLVGGKAKNKSTAEHLDEVAQWIADFGRTYGIWTITMAQLNQDDNTRGGEGIRLAFDQLYQIHRERLTEPYAWMEMMETRYTKWLNIGSKEDPALRMNEQGPFFEQMI